MNQDKKQIISHYLEKGLSVIPIAPRGKNPLVRWEKFQNAKAGMEDVEQWFSRWPDMNVGIVTGKISGLVVFDIDPRHGGKIEDFRKYGTLECKTGGNGAHFYFKCPQFPVKSMAGILPGVDIRADGGLVVAPPSIHNSGNRYTWNLAYGNETKSLPDELISLIREKDKQVSTFNPDVLNGVSEGGRNNTAASVIGKLLKRYREDEWVKEAWPLIMAWNDKNNPPLPPTELKQVFDSIAQRERRSRLTSMKTSQPSTNGAFFSFDPRLITELSSESLIADWLWEGYIAKGHVTLLSALWKAGKSTLISHLLKAFQEGSSFLGKSTCKTRVLVISEESESIWYRRRDDLDINTSVWLACRPVKQKLNYKEWVSLLTKCKDFSLEHQVDLIIIDTLSGFWNVQDENDAASVGSALLPLNSIVESKIGVLLIHHFRKSGGADGTAARGSGALSSYADIIIDFTRLESDGQSTRRELKALSRFEETPGEVVIELNEGTYASIGTKSEISKKFRLDEVLTILKEGKAEMSAKDIYDNWSAEGTRPVRRTIENYLKELLAGGRVALTSERVIGRSKTGFYCLPGVDERKEGDKHGMDTALTDKDIEDVFGGEICQC